MTTSIDNQIERKTKGISWIRLKIFNENINLHTRRKKCQQSSIVIGSDACHKSDRFARLFPALFVHGSIHVYF